MKKYLALAMFLVLAVVLTSPFSVSAKTKAGTKPGSFFYFFDKAIEKTNLFFTFSAEKKTKKALEHAEERLAEAEELKKEKEEKEIPEIIKEEIKKVEIPEKEINKTDNKLKEEGESEEKLEVINKKEEIIKKDDQAQKIEKLKKEIEALKQKTSQVKVVEKNIEKPVVVESKQSSSSQKNSQTKQKEVTLPNGAVVEMDENGNVVRAIKEAVINTTTQTIQSTSSYAGQTSSSSSDTPKLNVVVDEKDNILQSIQSGAVNFALATFNILNPISNEDIKLSEITFSISDFAKNVSELNVEIQLPIDDFGYSKKFIIGTKKSATDNFCKLVSLGGGNNYIDCTGFDLSKFQNISFDFLEESIIPAGKSVKIKILVNVIAGGGMCGPSCLGTTSIPGEYQNIVKLNSCSGIIVNKNTPIICDIENGLIFPNGISLVR